MMKQALVRHFPNREQMSHAAADFCVLCLSAAVRRQGHAAVVLSGGSTPRHLFELLASGSYRTKISWEKVFFFWADERCVAADHEDSNYYAAHERLLARVPVAAGHIFRIPVELGWRQAALAYEIAIKAFFLECRSAPACENLFDLVLLGVGADGHTASIFAGSPALDQPGRWVLAVEAPPGVPVRRRITLTMAALNNTGQAIVLAGADKRKIVEEIFERPGQQEKKYPAAGIHVSTTVFQADGD